MDNKDQQKRYDELAQKLLDGAISESELHEYLDWLNGDDEGPLNIPAHIAENREQLKQRIYSAVQPAIEHTAAVRKWYRYAAAAAILLMITGALGYFFVHSKNTMQTVASIDQPLANDALPGTTGAILTLANGQQLVLDSLGNGVIATQGKTHIAIQNGQLVYNALQAHGETMYNTMTTPKGRHYQLVLPDGSKVWLNAASSITFPTAFTGNNRQVKMTGEAYFEVAANRKKPFIVDVDGKANVQVLGTHFNINSYGDDDNIRTTLLEGKVKMSEANNLHNHVVLKPGEQAAFTAGGKKMAVQSGVDLEQVMAWKNGYFQFNETKLELVLKQLERWYNIDVVFEGNIPQETYMGELPANAPLSQILRVLEKTQVHFRIEGKRLIVTQ
jgi:Fe2+-dicitrate sensor, membrane component